MLASPLDEYDPGGVASVTAHPLFELAIAVVGVVGLLAVTRRRSERRSPPASTGDGRDPYIFGLEHAEPSSPVVALLYSGTGALAMMLLSFTI